MYRGEPVDAQCYVNSAWSVKLKSSAFELVDEVVIDQQLEARAQDWDLGLGLADAGEQ